MCLSFIIQLCESSNLSAKGKQPFYIYEFELLKTAPQTSKNLGVTEVFRGCIFFVATLWQGQKDLNPRHAVLETAALPTELYPYIYFCIRLSLPAAGNPSIVFCSIWRDKCVYLLKALFYYTYNLPFCQLLFYIVFTIIMDYRKFFADEYTLCRIRTALFYNFSPVKRDFERQSLKISFKSTVNLYAAVLILR